jgi:3-dehydroquinate synthase II
MMAESEGILVGCQASGLFLMQAEVTENPHVATRPFRVNAGAVSLYALAPGGKTRYLSEIAAGDEVLIVDRSGSTRKTCVARNKIERRPMLLIEAEAGGKTIKTIAQDAETIRIMTPSGSKSVSELKRGDEVLALLAESKARHFGMQVEETITEQ